MCVDKHAHTTFTATTLLIVLLTLMLTTTFPCDIGSYYISVVWLKHGHTFELFSVDVLNCSDIFRQHFKIMNSNLYPTWHIWKWNTLKRTCCGRYCFYCAENVRIMGLILKCQFLLWLVSYIQWKPVIVFLLYDYCMTFIKKNGSYSMTKENHILANSFILSCSCPDPVCICNPTAPSLNLA